MKSKKLKRIKSEMNKFKSITKINKMKKLFYIANVFIDRVFKITPFYSLRKVRYLMTNSNTTTLD